MGSLGDKLAKWVSVISAALLLVFSGIVIAEYKFFPYDVIRNAKNGLEAMLQLEDTATLNAIAFEAPNREAGPHITTYAADAGPEALLITGGFYQHLDLCPDHGCAAWIIDRAGNTLHTWEVDPAEIVQGAEGFEPGLDAANIRVVGTRSLPDGGLLMTLHARNTFPYTVGLVRLDKDGAIVWKSLDGAHHWFDLDPEGNIYISYAQARPVPRFVADTPITSHCPLDAYHGDGLAIYDPQGNMLRSFDIAELLADSPYAAVSYATRDGCDPYHLNSVEYLTAAKAARVQGAMAGDLLVSLRENNMVALINSESGEISHAVIGRTTAQHSPRLLNDGTVAVFDNLGGKRDGAGSAITRVDLTTSESSKLYPLPNGPANDLPPFFSGDGGHIDISPDGQRMMISSKTQAISFEVEIATGRVLWSIEKILDIKPYLDRVGKDVHAPTIGFNAYSAYYLTDKDIAFIRK